MEEQAGDSVNSEGFSEGPGSCTVLEPPSGPTLAYTLTQIRYRSCSIISFAVRLWTSSAVRTTMRHKTDYATQFFVGANAAVSASELLKRSSAYHHLCNKISNVAKEFERSICNLKYQRLDGQQSKEILQT